ncbi:MAG TPA: polysaccharide deacetylase family protein [Candidatus Xenobia bacterium]
MENPKLREQGYLPVAELKARREYELERGISFPELVRGSVALHTVALTFDDGPHQDYTPKLLDSLQKLHVTATFFVVGTQVDRYPQLVQQEAAAGHEVANHTYHHLRLASIPTRLIEPELREGAQAIERAIGTPTRLYRPPGGEYDPDVIEATKQLGYVMVLWTDDPGDYLHPGKTIIEDRVLRDISDGSVILLHDGVQQTIDMLPDLVGRLRARGFNFVTCTQMALERGVLKNGGPTVRPETPPR